MKLILSFSLIIFAMSINAQEVKITPYSEIPKMEENYTAGNVVARMVDGLGFRYFWATNCLREEDLAYKPNKEGRSSLETIHHLYDLSNTIMRLTKIEQSKDKAEMSYAEIRKQTLLNLEKVSIKLKKTKDLSEFSITKKNKISIPFFNVINGPIADAIWHTGQLASFRRSSGNPINSNVNHFNGTIKE